MVKVHYKVHVCEKKQFVGPMAASPYKIILIMLIHNGLISSIANTDKLFVDTFALLGFVRNIYSISKYYKRLHAKIGLQLLSSSG